MAASAVERETAPQVWMSLALRIREDSARLTHSTSVSESDTAIGNSGSATGGGATEATGGGATEAGGSATGGGPADSRGLGTGGGATEAAGTTGGGASAGGARNSV